MSGYCHHCNNTGWLECYCGGDLCVCENNGEYPCPHCGGIDDDDDFDEGDEIAPPVAEDTSKGDPR